ncbi:PKD domain-containing protein [uncultured Marixanthomonas sp.]|uniref:PKD domain-containing protein n=1 Tax=uncultured Marixanthomonas sp. TaxID=757245 RepID=UPI0030DAF6D4|tara:strand:- start:16417 stop:17409 length:993 start_codon:yes stop_codon:yes gene_type:complete
METRKNTYYHLDKTVLLFFVIAILGFSSLFAYKYYSLEDCPMVQFKNESKDYRVGSLIRFTDYTAGAESWEWHFDDSTDVRTERNPYHTFSKPGKYDVKLTVNGSCETIKTITIEEKAFILDSTKLPVFTAPKQIMVGKKIIAVDSTKGANTWEWRFGETASVNSYEKKAEYTYKESGLKTISLVVNGDLKHIGKRKIKVLPRPEDKERIERISSADPLDSDIKYKPDIEVIKDAPEGQKKKKVPYISERDFAQKLVDISEEKITSEALKRYICGNLNMPVIVNKKKEDLLVFCQKISGKKITVKDVQIHRDEESKCITNILINVNKGWF